MNAEMDNETAQTPIKIETAFSSLWDAFLDLFPIFTLAICSALVFVMFSYFSKSKAFFRTRLNYLMLGTVLGIFAAFLTYLGKIETLAAVVPAVFSGGIAFIFGKAFWHRIEDELLSDLSIILLSMLLFAMNYLIASRYFIVAF